MTLSLLLMIFNYYQQIVCGCLSSLLDYNICPFLFWPSEARDPRLSPLMFMQPRV